MASSRKVVPGKRREIGAESFAEDGWVSSGDSGTGRREIVWASRGLYCVEGRTTSLSYFFPQDAFTAIQ